MNDTISNVVITGRRMQSLRKAHVRSPLLRVAYLDLRAFGQQQRAIDDDRLAAVEAFDHNDLAVLRTADVDRLHMGGPVDDRENEIAALADLNRLARRDDRPGLIAQRHLKIAQLPWPEDLVGIVEDRVGHDRAGAGIDCIVEQRELGLSTSSCDPCGVAMTSAPLAMASRIAGSKVWVTRERDVDRRNLVDRRKYAGGAVVATP